ncbi:MAG TPA: hypothetical protein VLJ37_05285 [bacterium]|nr:hypothetical protein [bacterium]
MKRFYLLIIFAFGLTALNLTGPAGCGSGTPGAQCGDGVVSGGEICDGGALNGETCESQGFSSDGTLKCASDCGSFDTSGCVAPGTVSGLVDITGDGDEFVNLFPDSLGNLYIDISSKSSNVTAGGQSVANVLPNGTRRPSAGKVNPDGTLAWLKGFQGNGTTDDQGDFAFDHSGNPIFEGIFSGTTLTAPGKTLSNADGSGNTADAYAARLNPDGTILWFDAYAGANTEQVFLQSSPSGDLYVTGRFLSTTLAVGGQTLTNADGSGNTNDAFIEKIDPSDGSSVWVTQFSSDSFDSAFLSFDASGNIYVLGNFQGTKLAVKGTDQLTNASAGTNDGFAALLDPDTGDLQWITAFSSNQNDFMNSGTSADAAGNLYVRGQFTGATLTAKTKNLTNADGSGTTADVFIAKLDHADGSVTWLTGVSSSKPDSASFTTDASGNLYVGGSFQGPTLAVGGKTLTNADSSGNTADGFLGRLNPADGTAAWLVAFSSDGFDANASVLTDPSGSVYANSFFGGTAMTVSGRTLTNGDPSGTTFDSYIAKFNPDGTLVWLTGISGDGNDFFNLEPDRSGKLPSDDLFVDGQFKSATLSIGGGTLANTDTSGTTEDAFVGRLNPEDGTFLWMIPVSGNGIDRANVLPDDAGHLYLGGSFQGSSVSIGGQTFTNADSSGTTRDAFLGRIAP